jgi:Uma2 family endonuclease
MLTEFADSGAPRLAYDRGTLEIMSPLQEHEEWNRSIALLVEVLAEEWGLNIRNLGSTTFKRADLKRGFEPDSCFYIRSADRIRGKSRLSLEEDPPPDLVVEIEITSPSLDKLPIYALLGVPEVWRYDGRVMTILVLDNGSYRERTESLALPVIGKAVLTTFMDESKTLDRLDWLRQVRAWARQHRGPSDSS